MGEQHRIGTGCWGNAVANCSSTTVWSRSGDGGVERMNQPFSMSKEEKKAGGEGHWRVTFGLRGGGGGGSKVKVS